MNKFYTLLENLNSKTTVYHGGDDKDIIGELFVTDEEYIAEQYALMGGEAHLIYAEMNFEEEHGVSPQEYYEEEIEEYGEEYMWKQLLPTNYKPTVYTLNVPSELIKGGLGYKGEVLQVNPNWVVNKQSVEYNF